MSRVSPLCAAFCPDSECVRRSAAKPHVAPTCGQREKAQAQSAEKPRRGGKNPPVREEPASHLASRRSTGSPPNAPNRAEAHTHYFVTKSAARVTPCGRGHSTLRSLAPQFQTKPASLGFCLVEGKERYGGKYAKKQAIQYKNLGTGFRDNPPKISAGAHEPERLCDCVLANMGKVQFANLDSAV